MKKSIFIIITVLLMFNPYTVYAKHTHQTQSQTASISISQDDLKDDGQYQYNGLKWKSKLKDVKKEIPYTLKPLKYENLSANYKEQVYVANETFNLQGQNAILKLQFVDGELSQFLYAFKTVVWGRNQLEYKLFKHYKNEISNISLGFKRYNFTVNYDDGRNH